MPHQCIHCSEIYDDGAEEILKGCSKCHSRFFFYITKERLEKIKEKKEDTIDLSISERRQIEKDVREIVGEDELEEDVPIVLDFESVKIMKPGKYLIDVHRLLKKDGPLIYKLEDGKYIIDLTAVGKALG